MKRKKPPQNFIDDNVKSDYGRLNNLVSNKENGQVLDEIIVKKDIRMPEVNYEWIIELKYLKKSERNRLEEVKREGLKQLKGYVDSREFKDRENIKHALIVFIGKDEYEVVGHI